MSNPRHSPQQWIRFDLIDSTGKTNRWQVVTLDGNTVLGSVHWWGAWRQYSFFPQPSTVFERQCLRDIADFCELKTKEHRETKKENKCNQASVVS